MFSLVSCPPFESTRKRSSADKKFRQNIGTKLNYRGVEFPVSIKYYSKVEVQNSINVNVFGYEDKQYFPIYVSKQKNTNELNLLLITDGEKQHFVLIKDFDRMMYNSSKHHHRKHFCMHSPAFYYKRGLRPAQGELPNN